MFNYNVAGAEEILERVQREDIAFINLEFSDILGIVKSVTIPAHEFAECIEHGKWFDGSSIEGFARIAESDMYLEPDLATFSPVPWEASTAKVICNVYTPDGTPFPGDPRYVLRRVIQEAEDMGFQYMAGAELEFFLLQGQNETRHPGVIPHDQAGYFDIMRGQGSAIVKEMTTTLEAQGIIIETSHHEVARGQYEIDFKYDRALQVADNIVTAKYTIKSIAQLHNMTATFMPKPFFGTSGNGMHIHQSLFDPQTGKNLFYDPADTYGLTELARRFTAGQLAHARSMTAVLAPLINSYKRLVPGYEAPVYVTWARMNRAALIRVPRISPRKPSNTRIEMRSPDPTCNPYLAFTVMLKAGLEGIKQGLVAPTPVEENLYEWDEQRLARAGVGILPGSLNEALDAFEQDDLIQDALGDHLYERFLEAKRREWSDFRIQVTPWEIERYLGLY